MKYIIFSTVTNNYIFVEHPEEFSKLISKGTEQLKKSIFTSGIIAVKKEIPKLHVLNDLDNGVVFDRINNKFERCGNRDILIFDDSELFDEVYSKDSFIEQSSLGVIYLIELQSDSIELYPDSEEQPVMYPLVELNSCFIELHDDKRQTKIEFGNGRTDS